MFKLLLVKTDYSNCSEEGDEPGIGVQQVTLSELLNSSDYEIQAEVQRTGWRDVEKIEDIEQRKRLNQEYILIRPWTPITLPIPLENIQHSVLVTLARGAILTQKIDVESILTPEQLKEYKRCCREYKQQQKLVEERKKEAEAKKAERKAKRCSRKQLD